MSYYPPPGAANGAPGYGGFPNRPPVGSDQPPFAAGPAAGQPPFHMPPGMPPINFNAPVIRMGLPQTGRDSGPRGFADDRRGASDQNRNRLGLGADQDRAPRSEPPRVLTREEVARTIFITGLVDGSPADAKLEEFFGAGQGLRRWTRVSDADGKLCQFGFAEYDDAASLDTAAKVLDGLRIPLRTSADWTRDDDGNIKDTTIKVSIDPKSIQYIDQWTKPDEEEHQRRIESAREEAHVMVQLYKDSPDADSQYYKPMTMDAQEGQTTLDNAEMITIQGVPNAEDELSDIPADKREMIAAEIAAFRNRSTRRDLDRLKQEQEMEQAQRQRTMAPRVNRLAERHIEAPTGPADRATESDGYRGAQIPKDYVDGVTFVQSGADEDELDPASDAELFRRRRAKVDDELEKRYSDQKRRWLQAEGAHFAAQDRQKADEESLASKALVRQRELSKQLEEFDDEADMRQPTTLFYRNRKKWRRERRAILRDERRRDDRDRHDEKIETGDADPEYDRIKQEYSPRGDDRGYSDRFDQDRHGRAHRERSQNRRDDHHHHEDKYHDRREDQGYYGRTSNGRHGSRARHEEKGNRSSRSHRYDDGPMGSDTYDSDRHQARSSRDAAQRTVSDSPRPSPRKQDTAPMNGTTEPEERPPLYDAEQQQRRDQIDAMVPRSRDAIFNHAVNWRTMTTLIVAKYLKPFVDDKIREALGTVDPLISSDVLEIVRAQGSARQLLKLLKPLEDEADRVTREIWREVIVVGQCAANGVIES